MLPRALKQSVKLYHSFLTTILSLYTYVPRASVSLYNLHFSVRTCWLLLTLPLSRGVRLPQLPDQLPFSTERNKIWRSWMRVVGPRRMWAVHWEVMLVGLMVLVQVERCMQLRATHPMHGVVDRINENGGPYIGLVMAYPTEELALQSSAFFVPSSQIPWVDLAGSSSLSLSGF